MDINTLKQLVKAGLKDGKYALDTATLQSAGITAIATDYLPGAMLNLTPDLPNPFVEAADRITVNGTGLDTPCKGMKVAATFSILPTAKEELLSPADPQASCPKWIRSIRFLRWLYIFFRKKPSPLAGNLLAAVDEAALHMVGTAPDGWTLQQGFSVFANTLGDSLQFVGAPNSPKLTLRSARQGAAPVGMILDGTLDFSKLTYGVSKLLGIVTEAVSGPIVLKSGGTELNSIDLGDAPIANVNLFLAKDVPVDFSVQTYQTFNPFTKKYKPIPYLQVEAKIPFSSGGRQYSLPLAVGVRKWDAPIRFSADIDSLVDATLAALSSFAGGADFSKTLPPASDYPIEEVLTFSSLYMDVSPKDISVTAVGLQVKSVKEWTVLTVSSTGKTFTVSDMQLDFIVLNPFGGSPAPYLNIQGKLKLTDTAKLVVTASYPTFTVTGALADGAVLGIRELMAQFIENPPDIPDNFNITVLSFFLQQGNYQFEVDASGYWPLNMDQNVTLALTDIGFQLSYAGSLQAQFQASFLVGTVGIAVQASYAGGGELPGWQFSGKTGEGQLIPIGDFIAYAASTFGVSAPPSWITGMSLQDLAVDFSTANKNFHFSVTGNIPLGNNKLQIVLGFSMEAQEAGGYKKVLSGKITVAKSEFDLTVVASPSDTSFSASWKATEPSGYLTIADIASAFGFANVPEIPDRLELNLKEAGLFYDFTKKTLLLSAASANYGNAVFAAQSGANGWEYAFGIRMNTDGLQLKNLPLVGKDLEFLGPVGLKDFTLVLTPSPIVKTDVEVLNKLIAEQAGADYPQLPDEELQIGAYLALNMNLGSDNTYKFQLSTARKQPSALLLGKPQPLAASGATDNSVKWFSIQKNLGPLYLDKIGAGYSNGRVTLMLNASLILGALRMDLYELGGSTPLNSFDPGFTLSGLGISFKTGSIMIAGALLRQLVDGIEQYYGAATIQLSAFNLSALGSYANVSGSPSMFIFALLYNTPIGGDPSFFLTGIAAGFGYNRGLKLPDAAGLPDFPLVSGFVPGQPDPFGGADPMKALKVLVDKQIVPIDVGQNWIAAGIQFTTYEVLTSFAVISVAFGHDLEIGLLGMSTLSMPPQDPNPVAQAQLALSARFLPSQGFLGIDAQLTPASYILSRDCRLTGGFAFYVWGPGSANPGDFVITLGGYHPDFVPPSYYPQVPRLGFNWNVTSEVTLKGGIYFALTPTTIMAGGSLEATYQSGNLKAWFTIGADFLISWLPYHYDAHLYLSFGVSYTFRLNLIFTTVIKTISVSLGADLHIWGPDFSGTAKIHLWIVSFTISFGAGSSQAKTEVSWDEFKKTFLPDQNAGEMVQSKLALLREESMPTTTYATSKVITGLVSNVTKASKGTIDWIVNRTGTTLESATVFPSKTYTLVIKDSKGFSVPESQLVYTNKKELDDRNLNFGVGMVGVENDDFLSDHEVTILYAEELNPEILYEITALIQNVPNSLWQKSSRQLDPETTTPNALVGFTIRPLAPEPDACVQIRLANFQYQTSYFAGKLAEATPVPVDGPDQPADGMQAMQDTINSADTTQARNSVVDLLISKGVLPSATRIDVKEIADNGRQYILAAPHFAYTYWKKPA